MSNDFRVGDTVRPKPSARGILPESAFHGALVIRNITATAWSDTSVLWFDPKVLDGGWFTYRFDLISRPKPPGYVKQEFSVRYAQTPKNTQRVVERVVRRMKRKMPAWLFDGILVAMLEEARARIQGKEQV